MEQSFLTISISPGIADITNLDPHRASLIGDKGIVAEMFNALVRFPAGSSDPEVLEADLAERWESSADKKVWTFYLRKGPFFIPAKSHRHPPVFGDFKSRIGFPTRSYRCFPREHILDSPESLRYQRHLMYAQA